MVREIVHEESWAGAGAAVGLAAAQGASQSLEVVGVHLHPALIFLLVVAFISFLAGWWPRGAAGRWYEWVDFRKPALLGPAALTGSARIFDCGRGRYLSPPANATGNRYYALAERSTGRVGVFAGWSRLKAELPDGTTPSSLPQGSFIH